MESLQISANYRKKYTQSRENWCVALVKFFTAELIAFNIHAPRDRTIKISIAPIQRPKTVGLCYPSEHSPGGDVNHIVISPVQIEAQDLAQTVLHELLHAFDDVKSRHQGRWKRWANLFGMQAKHG